MLTAPVDVEEVVAPGLTVDCRSIVPVKEFALDDVFAASLTASSALADAGLDGTALADAGEEDPALALEFALQPVTAVATMTTSPAAYHGKRATLTCIKTSETRP
jgi:hypothetical protein